MSRYTLAEVLRKNRSAPGVNQDRVAAVFGDQERTYEAIDTRSNQLAHALAAQGFEHGDRVGVMLYNRLEWLEVFFAIAKLGGVMVPLNYLLRPAEVEFLLTDSQARWVVYEAALETSLADGPAGGHRRYLRLDGPDRADADLEYEEILDGMSTAEFRPEGYAVGSDDLVLLQYTSGTTGSPKGAMHTHSTVMWNSFHQIVDYSISSRDVVLVVPALCWAAGFHDLALASLWTGGRVVISPSTGFTPERFLRTVEAQQVTATLLVPTVLKRVLECSGLRDYDLTSLRLVCSGGEPVPLTAIDEFHDSFGGCDLLQVFGLSEFPSMMLYINPADARRKVGSTGKACSAAEVRIVGPDDQEVAAGETGEIICRSPANMIGYYGRDDATRATLRDGWLHTGDLGTVDESGFVYVSGRSKDMIITGGLNVYPAEVERVLSQHPAIAEAAVVGEPSDEFGETGLAFVVLAEGHEVEASDLIAYLRLELAAYKVPRHYKLSREPLPRTTSGKVQKFRLRGGIEV